MATFVTDTFTDTAGTTLESHTGETGATWAKVGASTGSVVVTDANRVRMNSSGVAAYYYASGAVGGANEPDVSVPFYHAGGTPQYAAILLRASTSNVNSNYYFGWDSAGGGRWQIQRNGTAVATSSAYAVSSGSTYTVRATCTVSGGSVVLTLYVNGVQQCTYTDSSPLAGTRVGVQFFGVATNSTGWHFADYTAQEFTGPLAAGTLSETTHGSTSAVMSWTSATGGTAPVTAQLQRSASGAGSWSNVSGGTTSPTTDSGLTSSTAYDYRVAFTDSAGSPATVYSSTVTVTTSGGATVADASLFFSPYNWLLSGSSYAQSANPGAYFRTKFSGTSVKLDVDVSPCVAAGLTSGLYPVVAYAVDGPACPTDPTSASYATDLAAYLAAFTRAQLTSSTTQLTLGTGLAAGTHTLEVWFDAAGSVTSDRWNTPGVSVKVTGLTLDSGAALSAPTLRGRRAVAYGDSITEAYNALAAADHGSTSEARASYAHLLAVAMGAEVGIIGWASQSYNLVGSGNVPVLTTSYSLHWSGQSRLSGGVLSPAPDYCLDGHGTNGGTAAQVTAFVGTLRAIAPAARVFELVPFGQYVKSAKTTGVANYLTANPSELKVHLIDTGVDYDNDGSLTQDGLHPNVAGHRTYVVGLWPLVRASIPSARRRRALVCGGN